VQFYRDPSSSIRDDLQRIRTPWSRASSRPSLGFIDHSSWRRYRLYAKGFEYQAVELGSTLRNVTLRPTPENPLGIFHRTGNLRLDDNVTVQGTLVVTGNLQIDGDLVQIAGYNWRNDDGNPIAPRAEHWPRLPAVVAYSIGIDRECRLNVQGAIITQSTFAGAGGDYELMNVNNVSFSGTATCRRLGQPLSLVQLSGTPNLTSLNNRGDYSIWLDRGSSGDWYTIVGVDAANRRLTIIGEIEQPSATGYRIARSRRSSVDLFGLLAATTVDINRPDAWASLTHFHWSERRDRWDDLNDWRRDRGLSPIEFVDWLATSGNWSGWWYPLSSYGLPLEPTFHLRPMTGTTYRWSPPIFEAYDGSGSQQSFAGYRWKVLSWREVP
jgi:hypothetical protein